MKVNILAADKELAAWKESVHVVFNWRVTLSEVLCKQVCVKQDKRDLEKNPSV